MLTRDDLAWHCGTKCYETETFDLFVEFTIANSHPIKVRMPEARLLIWNLQRLWFSLHSYFKLMAVYESHLAGGEDLSVQEGIIYIQT